METSAKTGMNAQELFTEAAKLLFKDYSNLKIVKNKKEGQELKSNNKEKKKKNCC